MHTQPTVLPPQTGVAPEQAPQLGPQLAAVSQSTQPVPVHIAPGPHEVASHTHWAPLQIGVFPEQGAHEAPQAAELSQATQALSSHRLPEPHWPSFVHSTQLPW